MAEWHQIKEIFGDALEIAPEKRAAFLERVCAGDEPLRLEVESLLASSENVSEFMEQAAAADAAEMFDDKKSSDRVNGSFNHYEIIKQIGAGGMGEVYLANDKKLERKVAVKILNEKFARHESNLQRFIKEAKSASALNHPNILVIHEIGETEDAHFIVSEYVEGKTLREILREKSLQLKAILDISIQIAGALAAAHQARIVHRDIKPENIIVRPDGYVKILDFGLAKLVEEKNKSFIGLEESTVRQNETAKGIILGTVNYMSPEQAKGEPVDARTDVFSLGVVLFEMIAGKAPFAGETMSETFANLIKTEPFPLARYTANVPEELQRIVSKTLKKKKNERYQTTLDLLTDLQELRENLTFEEKLERSQAPSDEHKTVALPSKTGDLNGQTKQTGQFSEIFARKRSLIAGSALLFLLAAVSIFVWRWRQETSALSPLPIKSLAVLPLKSLDNGENYLGLGITDAVIRRISQTNSLIVRPTSAVRHYLNEDTDALIAAKQLNTDAVLEGNVQKSNDRLRVSVNLLRTGDGTSIWADSFDFPATDAFAIQDEVSQQVASHLQLQLNPSQQARLIAPSTSNPVAYDYYLRGVYAFDQSGFSADTKPKLETAIDFFKKAIETDSNFALAHAKLGYALAWMGVFIEPAQQSVWAKQAEEEINKSQELDSQLAETHEARQLLLFSAYGNFQNEAAIREGLLAQQLNPNVGHDSLAANYQHIGLEDLAERELQRALEVDPTSEAVKVQIFNLPLLVGNYDGWFAACQKNTPNDCQHFPWYLMGKNRLDDAQQAIDEEMVRIPNDLELPQNRALLYALKGDFSAAEAEIPVVLDKNPRAHPHYHHATYVIACIYALEGKTDEAVNWLRETAATGFPCYPLFKRDAYLDRIRQTPEFIQFLKEQKAQNGKFLSEFQ